VSLYLDTSCLVTLLKAEPETAAVARVVQGETEVLVSALALLEAELQITAARLGGDLTPAQARQAGAALAATLAQPPFVVRAFATDVFQIARRQSAGGAYCRTLDRLHLAAMEALGVDRLLTNDARQAAAARALGFGVVWPR
jgi:predicted nucleic acid-binding protein